MENEPRKLTAEETENIREQFLISFGNNVRDAREQLNIPQAELAGVLGLRGTALSNYENGVRDMKISNLPLISIYCHKRMPELLPVDQDAFLEAFNGNVGIIAYKYHRDEEQKAMAAHKELVAKVYSVNGVLYEEQVVHRKIRESTEDRYRRCEIEPVADPFTDEEFVRYVTESNPMIASLIPPIFELAVQMGDKRRYYPAGLPKFILDEAVINAIVKDPGNEKAQKAYAYYYKKYRHFYDNEPRLKELLELEFDDDIPKDRPAKKKQSNDYGQMSLFDFLDDDKDDGGDDE